MNKLARLGVFSCLLAPLFAGCVEGQPIDDADEDVGEAELADKNGTSGSNGMSWDDYTLAEADLIASTDFPLLQSDEPAVTASVEGRLLANPAGAAIFKYVVACAVPAGVIVTSSAGKFMGRGHMAAAGKWSKGPLDHEDLEALLSCMVAHLNPYGYTVPILLSGPNAGVDHEDHSDYWVDEALWTATQVHPGRVDYVVYPLSAVDKYCGPNPQVALMHRLCGQSPSACNFEVGDLHDCLGTPDGYYCQGLPAMMTSLETGGLEAMYPTCQD